MGIDVFLQVHRQIFKDQIQFGLLQVNVMFISLRTTFFHLHQDIFQANNIWMLKLLQQGNLSDSRGRDLAFALKLTQNIFQKNLLSIVIEVTYPLILGF